MRYRCYISYPHLHSFPTRRSSDLEGHPHGGWSMRFPTPDGEQFKFEELLAADVQLMGRVTYDGFAAAWPAMEEVTGDRKSTRLNSSHANISYDVFCL